MSLEIRWTKLEDWEQIKWIYEAGIATGDATFETQAPPTYETWISKAILECTLVAQDDDVLLGWIKLSPVSDRCVYSGVGEVSIYVHPEAKGKGIGDRLLEELIKRSEQQGFWTLQAGIFLENLPSLNLHRKHGFRELGRRNRIGRMNGVWRDVLLLERRSNIVGVD